MSPRVVGEAAMDDACMSGFRGWALRATLQTVLLPRSRWCSCAAGGSCAPTAGFVPQTTDSLRDGRGRTGGRGLRRPHRHPPPPARGSAGLHTASPRLGALLSLSIRPSSVIVAQLRSIFNSTLRDPVYHPHHSGVTRARGRCAIDRLELSSIPRPSLPALLEKIPISSSSVHANPRSCCICTGGSPSISPRSESRLRRPPVSELLALPAPFTSTAAGSTSAAPPRRHVLAEDGQALWGTPTGRRPWPPEHHSIACGCRGWDRWVCGAGLDRRSWTRTGDALDRLLAGCGRVDATPH
ncbi:hypothetical protein B0H14DRAFT_2565711 [Mycena olivaceomarginata]|nr:hypothetical protein B0H14DRAFT_2565711 [Mycena olivaceomarginata]